jgi:hypothetical protein
VKAGTVPAMRTAPTRQSSALAFGCAVAMLALPSVAEAKVYPLKRCGTVPTITEGVRAQEKVSTRGYSCSTARRMVRRSNKGTLPKGWRSFGSGEGVYLMKTRSSARLLEIINNPSKLRRSKFIHGDLTI